MPVFYILVVDFVKLFRVLFVYFLKNVKGGTGMNRLLGKVHITSSDLTINILYISEGRDTIHTQNIYKHVPTAAHCTTSLEHLGLMYGKAKRSD